MLVVVLATALAVALALKGYGMWAVEELSGGAFVGRVGFHYPEGWPDREVAWALARPYWGRGYALEAASAVLRVAFEMLDWPRVISLVAPLNVRSIRLAERLGERFERSLLVRGHQVGLYALHREHWVCGRRAPLNVIVRAHKSRQRRELSYEDDK